MNQVSVKDKDGRILTEKKRNVQEWETLLRNFPQFKRGRGVVNTAGVEMIKRVLKKNHHIIAREEVWKALKNSSPENQMKLTGFRSIRCQGKRLW